MPEAGLYVLSSEVDRLAAELGPEAGEDFFGLNAK